MGGRGVSSGRLIRGSNNDRHKDNLIDIELKKINPNFYMTNADERGYKDNCVKCCYTYDAIAREMNVEQNLQHLKMIML